MHRHQQHMLVLRQAQKLPADQGARIQSKRSRGLDRGQALQFAFNIRMTAQIALAKRKAATFRRNPLHRLAVDHGKARAQRLVTGNDAAESLDQRITVKPPFSLRPPGM